MRQPTATGHLLRPIGDPIRSDQEGSFAWGVLARRHPALIEQVRRAHPYGPAQLGRLDALREEITRGVITALPVTAADHDTWQTWAVPDPSDSNDSDSHGDGDGDGGGVSYLGRSWFEVPFLWAESYFYRRLLDAVDYYSDGPWAGVDPFEPAKTTELASIGASIEKVAVPQSRHDLLLGSVWGNRADLSFQADHRRDASHARPSSDPDVDPDVGALLVDDSARLWQVLEGGDPGRVVVVTDNAGPELLADLLLADHLLTAHAAGQVALHVKPAPYYVSDATTADVSAGLRLLAGAGPGPAAVAARLYAAAAAGALRIEIDPFYCAPRPFHHLPEHLTRTYASARLVILKGDLNYRRLVGDTHQPATTTFTQATDYFPAPVAALRTLKSDVIVGLTPGALAALDATGQPWRINGSHAVIQVNT